MKVQTQEKLFNTLSIIIFAGLVIVSGYLFERSGHRFDSIKTSEVIVIILAAFRLTRLVVHDRIFRLPREIVASFPDIGFMVSIRSLLTCPWCAGVWSALMAFWFQYLIPYTKYLNLLLAIAGVATFLLILVGRIAYKTEQGQPPERPDNEAPGCE